MQHVYNSNFFIIWCLGRSGSRYLNNLLNSHVNLVTHPEPTGDLSRDHQGLINYFTDIFDYSSKSPIGCKVKYLTVWKYGLRDFFFKRNVKVIHLKRKNILDCIISKALGEIYGWYAKTENDVYEKKIYLSYDFCLSRFKFYDRAMKAADWTFSSLPMIEIFYEDLCLQKNIECNKILDFLGVEETNLYSNSIKQRQNKRQIDLVENYIELKNQFAITEWGRYFNE